MAEVPLHQSNEERTSILRIPAGKTCSLQDRSGGVELLIISGKLSTGSEDWPADTWIRTPSCNYDLNAANEDTLILVKSGHLSL
ncbi:MAG: cupin domain-containing protein [Endozoicomonas sp.]|uniref:cupin domain-containing protein n=1 Tax=Endozoicomonas sp. TaxID=1892382 RepID=UPI003D9BCD67